MDTNAEGLESTGEPAGTSDAETDSDAPVITDKRRARLAILNEPTDYSKNANRLSNVRFPIGEEPWPDAEATDNESPWVNLKLEQHLPEAEPNQRHLLHGGPEIRIKCDKCNASMHIAAEMSAKDVIEGSGRKIPERNVTKFAAAMIVACVCDNGHLLQVRGDMIERLIKRG